jgi:phosphohistidine phosphatase
MKHLFLVRHAKSSWDEPGLTDIERPLNNRGKKDAPFMGKIIAAKKFKPDLIISSPAQRARKTAIAFADEFDMKKKEIVFDDKIYEATSSELLEIIRNIDKDFKSVMLFGHNPGLTNLNNTLSQKYIDNIPTCGIVALKFEEDWKDIKPKSAVQEFFEYPKLHGKRED